MKQAALLSAPEDGIDQSLANWLLSALPVAERQQLLAHATFVELAAAQVLGTAGRPLHHVWFPTSCMISLMPRPTGGASIAVGLVGPEGVLGAGRALGIAASTFNAVVQGAGHAWRAEPHALAQQVLRSRKLGALLTRHLSVQIAQLGRQAVCSRFHSLPQRLARLLLMSQDRLASPDLLITHETLASLLGARRAGVTVAAGLVQQRGYIRYSRGHILVLDRAGLKTVACSCYAQDLATYENTLGVPRVPAGRG